MGLFWLHAREDDKESNEQRWESIADELGVPLGLPDKKKAGREENNHPKDVEPCLLGQFEFFGIAAR